MFATDLTKNHFSTNDDYLAERNATARYNVEAFAKLINLTPEQLTGLVDGGNFKNPARIIAVTGREVYVANPSGELACDYQVIVNAGHLSAMTICVHCEHTGAMYVL